MDKRKSLAVKIVVPLLIVAAIAAIIVIKTGINKTNESETTQNTSTSELSDNLKNADFSLRETEEIDFEQLSSYGLPIIVDYGADSCVPCKQMAPVLEKANKEFEGKAFIKFVNVWDYPNAANNVPVQLIPTQVIFNADGTPFVPSEELAAQMEFTTYQDDNGKHIFTTHQGGLTEEQMWAILKEMGAE